MFITTRLLVALAVIAGVLALRCTPSLTWAALPANEQWREAITSTWVGYGRNTTGGKGGTLCTVTNLNDSGAGSLRNCVAQGGPSSPTWIIFSVSGTITLTQPLILQSNTTIDGRVADITIAGYGLQMGIWVKNGTSTLYGNAVDNVILENLKIENIDDLVWSSGAVFVTNQATNVVVDHLTIHNHVDEGIYIGSGTPGTNIDPDNITVSYVHWIYPTVDNCLLNPVPGNYCNKALLSASSDAASPGVRLHFTIHHNWYEQIYNREPLISNRATIHSFNNVADRSQGTTAEIYGSTDFRSEGDMFFAPYPNPNVWIHQGGAHAVLVTGQYQDIPANSCYDTWNNISNAPCVEQVNPGSIFTPPYSYTVDTASPSLATTIKSQAGWQPVTPPLSLSPPQNLRVLNTSAL